MLYLNPSKDKRNLFLTTALGCFFSLILTSQEALTCPNGADEEGGQGTSSTHSPAPKYETPPADGSSPISSLPPEILLNVFLHLPPKEMLQASGTNRLFYEMAQVSFDDRFKAFSAYLDNETLSLKDKKDCLTNSPSLFAYYKHRYVETLKDKGFVFSPQNAFLRTELNKALLHKPGVRVLFLDAVAGAPEEEIFKALFPDHATELTKYQKAVMQDLLHNFKVYVAADQAGKVWSNKDTLIQQLQSLQEKRHYIPFADINEKNEDYKTMPHRIVISTEELTHGNNKARLQHLLEINPEHKVILTVSATSVNNAGEFNLSRNQVPNNIKQLILSDPDHYVKSIGDYFLQNCTSLIAFDSSGLTALKEVGDGFLFYCTSLTTFKSSSFSALEKVGNYFLFYCTSLMTFENSGLIALEEIGDNFLDSCENLMTFDTSGFTALETVGRHSLYWCTSLKEITASKGLKALLELKIPEDIKAKLTWVLVTR